MATYKEIHGVKVQYRDSDATAIEGDVWYNASTGKLKMYASVGSWATGSNLGTARYGCAGVGTATEALCIGGSTPPGAEEVIVEDYDGSTWTEIADINTARAHHEAGGTTTAASAVGGFTGPPTVRRDEHEQWNGTSWTETTDLNAGSSGASGMMGTVNTALVFVGGARAGDNISTSSETWDGSSWTEGNDLNTGRGDGHGYGTSTAGGIIGGTTPPYSTLHEAYDGSSYSETADWNTARAGHVGGGESGTAAVMWAGNITGAKEDKTEMWDGTAWTEVADLPGTHFSYGAGSGISTNALGAGGYIQPGTKIATSYEWSFSASVETVAFD